MNEALVEAIRALDTSTVLAALGVIRARCPACGGRFEAHEDGDGVRVRCRSRCRLGRLQWSWPEYLAAELWRTATVAQAGQRILGTSRQPKIVPVSHVSSSVAKLNVILGAA